MRQKQTAHSVHQIVGPCNQDRQYHLERCLSATNLNDLEPVAPTANNAKGQPSQVPRHGGNVPGSFGEPVQSKQLFFPARVSLALRY